MIKLLIVEDDTLKYGRIYNALTSNGVAGSDIEHVISAADAYKVLEKNRYDIVLLDINIPRRLGESPVRGGGISLLSDLRRNTSLNLPRYVIGVTAYDDVATEFGQKFQDELWSIVLYSEASDYWVSQLVSKIDYVAAAKKSENFRDGVTYGSDVVVICALESVELGAVRDLPCSWQPLRVPYDESRYYSGSIKGKSRNLSVIIGAAPRMGMPAAAVLASKMISQFRPRIVTMVGICAGRNAKTNLGDVIIAAPSWDWGSGKIDSHENKPRFRPSPHHLDMDIDFVETIKEICNDVGALATIKSQSRGTKPNTDLKVHFGPLASGAAVVANTEIFEQLIDHNRDVLGLEMEAYGVAAACSGMGKPRPLCILMKSVCDYADAEKNDNYQEYAAHTSARLMHYIMQKLEL